MLKKISLSVLYVLASWSFAEACSISPEYYPSEYDSKNTQARSLIKDSVSIITGHFIKTKKNRPLKFKINHSIKPNKQPFFFKIKKVEFLDVKNISFYKDKKDDSNQFTDVSTLETLLDYYSAKPVEPMVSNYLANYWGGPLAGIYHGSDCERFVHIYKDDEYILFLNEDNTINARFTLPENSSEILRRIETQIKKGQN